MPESTTSPSSRQRGSPARSHAPIHDASRKEGLYGESPADGSSVVGPDGLDIACTNPAALGGGQALFRAGYFPISNIQLYAVTPFPDFRTPFDIYETFYAGACLKEDHNRSYLDSRVRPDPGDLRQNVIPFDHPRFSPSFLGTHILDYYLALGDLMDLVQTKTGTVP